MHPDADVLALAALGEGAPSDEQDHLAGCADCRAEIRSLHEIVELARTPDPLLPVGAHVWDAVAAATADPPRPIARRRLPRRGAVNLLAAAAAAAVVALGAGVAVIGSIPPGPQVVARAALAPQPGAPPTARGTVEIVESGGRLAARVTMSGLPPHDGVYEVWLYDGGETMIPLGVTSGGAVELPIPETVSLVAYPVVDVSAQRLGQQEHGTSVLQGRVPV